jgi:hypothetical protein
VTQAALWRLIRVRESDSGVGSCSAVFCIFTTTFSMLWLWIPNIVSLFVPAWLLSVWLMVFESWEGPVVMPSLWILLMLFLLFLGGLSDGLSHSCIGI